ncbi:unnamed protein product [Owenia fusiformis]|uniref:Uncharacterized protein n=1 Tax=Owenia fusiformis TaxID=6347 RepID=A0A8J1U239_OWEFU|nr:unnamed protein product [Owenia fusiformis]
MDMDTLNGSVSTGISSNLTLIISTSIMASEESIGMSSNSMLTSTSSLITSSNLTADSVLTSVISNVTSTDSAAPTLSLLQHIPSSNQSLYPEYRIARMLGLYCPPVIILLGLIGNSLTFWLLCRSPLKYSSTSVYLRVLSIVDSLVLVIALVRLWIMELSLELTGQRFDLKEISAATCQVFYFLIYFLVQLSAWILVGVSFERIIAVWLPFKAKQLNTQRNSVKFLCVVSVCFAVLDAHIFFTMTKSEEEHDINDIGSVYRKNRCTFSNEKYYPFIPIIWTTIDSCLACFVPFIIMLTSNLLIIYKITKRDRRYNNYATESSSQHGNKRSSSMTLILLSVNFTFLITTAPLNVWFILKDSTGKVHLGLEGKLRIELINDVLLYFMYLNNAVNFLLYCFAGPKFRQELKRACGYVNESPTAA